MVLLQNYDEAISYLADLETFIHRTEVDGLVNLVSFEKQYLEAKNEGGLPFIGLNIGESGFPSAPSLQADVQTIYDQSKRVLAAEKSNIESLALGEGTTISNNHSLIYVAPKLIGPFVEPTIVDESGETKDIRFNQFNESEGWFNYSTQKKISEVSITPQSVAESFTRNYDEFLAAGLAVGLGITLTPLAALVLPGWWVLKYAREEREKGYFLSDLTGAIKDKIDKGRKLKNLFKLDDAITNESMFKFVHPLVDPDIESPVLFYRKANGGESVKNSPIRMVGESYTAGQIEEGFEAEKEIPKIFANIVHNGKKTNYNLPRIKKTTANVIRKVNSNRQPNSPEKSLMELGQEQINELEKIITSHSSGLKIVKPERVLVDAYGILYPSPAFWHPSKGNADDCRDLNNALIRYLTGKESAIDVFSDEKMISFLKKGFCGGGYFDSSQGNIGLLSGLYCFVDEKQFELSPDFNKINTKINLAGRGTMHVKLKQYFETKDNKKILNGVSFVGNGQLIGNSDGFTNLVGELAKNTQILKEIVESGNFKREELQERKKEIERLQKEIHQKFRLRGEAASQVAERIRDISRISLLAE